MDKLIAYTVLSVLVTSCLFKNNDTSDPEFVAIEQEPDSYKGENFLIKKVHNPKFFIHYGFSDNKYCDDRFSNHQQQLKDSISKSLRVWLAPLVGRNNITDTYEYYYRDTTLSRDTPDFIDNERFEIVFKKEEQGSGGSLFSSCASNLKNESSDLAIIFYCQQGRSFARISKKYAEIHMYQVKTNKPNMLGVTDQKKYRITTLHHEIGHAFGLADTYIESGDYWRYNVSDGGASYTIGKQPVSVMNNSYTGVNPETGKLLLGADDVAGITWLYKYYITKSFGINDCPTDYLYEKSTKGCRPRYPLIFAVKQNDWDTIKGILDNDLTVINQQDELGNSALHYAAGSSTMHGDRLYRHLIDKGINTKLKNNIGKIASELLSEK